MRVMIQNLLSWLLLGSLIVHVQANSTEILTDGRCEVFDSLPMACQFILSPIPIWVAPSYGLTQEFWESSMYTPSINSSISAMDLILLMPFDCATSYLSLMCPTFFRPCDATSPFPLSMCKSNCFNVNEICFPYFEFSLLDCDQLDPLTGTSLWPDPDQSYPPFSCLNASDFSRTLPNYPCPQPLIFAGPNSDPYTGLPCSSSCHDKLRQLTNDPDRNFDIAFIVFSILNWISFVLVILTIIAYTIFPSNRKFPKNLAIWIGFGLFVVYLGFVGNSFLQPDDNFCKSDFALEDGSSWCRFQAWTSIFGSLIVVWYWSFTSFTMFWNIGLLYFRKNHLEKVSSSFHVFVFVYSFTASMVLMWVPDSSALGAPPIFFSCFNGPSWDANLAYALYWWPFYLGMFVVVFCTIWSIVSIARTPTVLNRSKSFKERLSPQLTICMFLLAWLVTVILLIAVNSTFEADKQEISAALTSWYMCVFSGTTADDCEVRYNFNAVLLWFESLSIATVGIWYALIYGIINPNQRKLYHSVITNFREGRPLIDSRISTRRTGSAISPKPTSS